MYSEKAEAGSAVEGIENVIYAVRQSTVNPAKKEKMLQKLDSWMQEWLSLSCKEIFKDEC